jgi:hypothetical protein
MLPAFPGRETDSRRIVIIYNGEPVAEQIGLRLHVQATGPLPIEHHRLYSAIIEQTTTSTVNNH